MQLYRYFVSQSNEFCCYNPFCCFSASVYFLFRYRLSPETFGDTLVFPLFIVLLTQGQIPVVMFIH